MRGHFGIGVYNPKFEANVGGIWRSAGCFGADWLFTIGKRVRKQATDTRLQYKHTPFFNFDTFEDFKKHLPLDTKLIAVELAAKSKVLTTYIHPERAIYLLGAEDTGLPKHILDQCDHIIEIPAPSLNVASAASIILYDRISKNDRAERVLV